MQPRLSQGAADGRGHEAGQQDRQGPLNCYSSSKLILNKSFETNLEDLLKEETEAQAAARLHPNGDEGLAAFLEKRKTNFQ